MANACCQICLKDNVTLAHIQLNSVMCESIKQCAVLCMKLTISIFVQVLLSVSSSHEYNAFMATAQRQQYLQHLLLYHINHANQQHNALNVYIVLNLKWSDWYVIVND